VNGAWKNEEGAAEENGDAIKKLITKCAGPALKDEETMGHKAAFAKAQAPHQGFGCPNE
jgi:hypothetical protein